MEHNTTFLQYEFKELAELDIGKWTVWSVCRDLLSGCRDLLDGCRALLSGCRALLSGCRALLRV